MFQDIAIYADWYKDEVTYCDLIWGISRLGNQFKHKIIRNTYIGMFILATLTLDVQLD